MPHSTAPPPQPPSSGEAALLATLGRLAGGLAHDFNNLLGVISNNTHLLQDHVQDEEGRELLESTLRAVETGSQLTRQLLRLAHPRAAAPRRIELAHFLPEVQALLRGLLGRRLDISVDVAPGTRPLQVDPAGLELALLALGLNAREALPRGGGLRLQAANAAPADLEPPEGWVRLAVSDDGPDGWRELGPVHAFCEQAGGSARLGSQDGGTVVTLLLPAAGA